MMKVGLLVDKIIEKQPVFIHCLCIIIHYLCVTKETYTMKIQVNGHEEEAYALIMRKEHALEILRGEKILEIRWYSEKYWGMFIDKGVLEANRKARAEGRTDDIKPPYRTDIHYVHFYNYNNTWSLDCEIDGIGRAFLTREDIEYLNDRYDFHDYDNEWQQYEGMREDETPLFFYLHIASVVGHRGLE